MGWASALGPQMLPSACSQFPGGPIWLPLHLEWVTRDPVFFPLRHADCACRQSPEVSGSKERIRTSGGRKED